MKKFNVFGMGCALVSALYCGCSDDSSTAVEPEIPVSSEAVSPLISSSSVVDGAVSSSVEEVGLSSTAEEIGLSSVAENSGDVASSSSATGDVLRVPAGGVFRWTAADDGARVITGLDNGSGFSGYWFTYNDNDDGGMSSIVWPMECPNFYSEEECVAESIEESQGVALSFTLDKGTLTYKPFVAVGFNIAGESEETRNPEAADASSWGGLCVAYASTHDITLELGFGAEVDAQIGYDNPSAKLPKSEDGAVKCIPWSNFIKAGLNTDVTEATKKLVAVKFKFVGEDKDKGKFNIMSVGSFVAQ